MTKTHRADLWKAACVSLLLCLLGALPPRAFAADAVAPLSPSEFDAVLAEVKRMVDTPSSEAERFVVREATPERIQRLYAMPEWLAQPLTIRENGLIFAGQGPLLRFDQPSNILAKVSSWFPTELEQARMDPYQQVGSHLHLWGPYPSWQDEPAAFMGLWNCMPQVIWMWPEADPFMPPPGTSYLAHHPIASLRANSDRADFGLCIREFNGLRAAATAPERTAIQQEVQGIGARVADVLQTKFDRFLSAQRCQRHGPDDCVLMLRLWGSLAPQAPRLAETLRRLEPEALPGTPLRADHRMGGLLRTSTFLETKVRSILTAPGAWPKEALPAVLRQSTDLQRTFFQTLVDLRYPQGLRYRSAMLGPMWPLREHMATANPIRDAVLAEIDRIEGDDAECQGHAQWFLGLGPAVEATHALTWQRKGRPSACAHPDWAWLKTDPSAQAVELRTLWLAEMARPSHAGKEREAMLSLMTDHGEACFGEAAAKAPPWQSALCRRWVHAPTHTPLRLRHGQLVLDPAHAFEKRTFTAPRDEASGAFIGDQVSWLSALTQGMPADAAAAVRAYALDLKRQHKAIGSVDQWRHPAHSRSLLHVRVFDNEGTEAYLILSPHALQPVAVPRRLRSDNGGYQVVRVSDLDADGNLEWWSSDDFERCNGDQSDLDRNVDCSARSANMGEVSGDTLSYFTDDRARRTPPGRDEHWRSGPFTRSPAPATPGQAPPCNRVLFGTILSPALGIEVGTPQDPDDTDPVIDLVCAPHPLDPHLSLVALFHALKEAPNGNGESRRGFAMAVVDVRRRQVVRLYRDTVEEDAITHVQEGSLRLDTARYQLAPGVRALGVRMNIAHSPRYAEGGEDDYLTLLVEEGGQLRPILVRRPMSHWQMTDTSCWREPEGSCVIEESQTRIAIAKTSTNGWRDLDLIETKNTEGADEGRATHHQVGTLRARHKVYK